ncbi:putative F-box domain-containing protein [Rosa chinensis]|uniref:Putative F-box domain-containing protein n=2 Tax=Rosa chinensis TaxID=74649 RepID=A0A2P6QIB7_ROSCH|nr:putative F-box domain-containing protein [Rosa chinensis]
MEFMIKTVLVCGCLVFGGVVIKRLFRHKPCWETLPDDIMEVIVPHLSVRDRIRLSLVCKPWSSVPMCKDIPSSPHKLPWLVLPQPESQALTCNDTSLSFYDLHDGKFVKLELPEPVRGAWFRGSSKGWLIMIKESEQNTTTFLVNPISGVQHQLPSLRTIPSFQKFVETKKWKRYGAFAFFNCLVLSTSDIHSDECVVAAALGCANDILGLCRPGDKEWNIFRLLDADEALTDVLFCSGKLYALVVSNNKSGVVSTARTLNFGDHSVELKLIYNANINFHTNSEYHGNYEIYVQGYVDSYLIESATNKEVLLIHQRLDVFSSIGDNNNGENGGGGNHEEEEEEVEVEVEGNDGGDDANEEWNNLGGNGGDIGDWAINIVEEDDHYLRTYLRTSGFDVYRIDPQNDNFEMVQSLGDKLLFLSNAGSFSLRASDIKIKDFRGNCICFATNNFMSLHSLETYTCREIGVFDLNARRMRRPFPSVEVSNRSQLCWFTPML